MTCMLRASGVAFDVDDFVAASPLVIHSSWRRGEKKFRGSAQEARMSSSGIRVIASAADFDEVTQQLSDAVQFLAANLEAIQRLSSFPGVEEVLLDFGVAIHPPGWASFTFPVELLKLAAEARVAVAVSVYPSDEGQIVEP